jgi:hypothetical protein
MAGHLGSGVRASREAPRLTCRRKSMGVAREVEAFPGNIEAICAAAATYARARNCPVERGLLERCRPSLAAPEYDNWDGGMWSWPLRLELEPADFNSIKGPEERRQIEHNIEEIVDEILRGRYLPHVVGRVTVVPRLVLVEAGPTNQGRAHSLHPAALEDDGVYYRSHPERLLGREAKRRGVLVAPLPLFLTPRRVEPDFLILHAGVALVVEVDGPSHTETPVEAQDRLLPFKRQGVEVYRVAATSCSSEAQASRTMEQILEHIARLKANR